MSQAVATHVEIRPNREGHDRAYIAGTRVRVQDIVAMSEMRGYTPDQIVEALPHISLGQVHAALSYYFDHQAEIQRELQEDRDLVREIRSRLGPSVLESRLKSVMDPTGDSISS